MGRYRIRDPYADPTPGQRAKAAELGIEVPPGIKKGAMSDLIDDFIATRKPTDDQITFATALGIEVTAEMTSVELSDLMDQVIRERSIQAMKDNTDLRAGKVIMYKGMPYTIECIGGIKGRYRADLQPLRIMKERFSPSHPKPDTYRVKQVQIVTIAEAKAVTRDELHNFIVNYFDDTPD